MSKPLSYKYTGTKGHIAAVANGLPKNPDSLLENGWKEVTDPRAKASSNSRIFKEISTGLRIRFDKGIPGENGFGGKDHYHIDNPNATDKKIDRYLDKNGNPVNKNSKASHILPEGGH